MMIYSYSRALGSVEPFPIAKQNLTRLLKKFGVLFNCLLMILEGVEPNNSNISEMLNNFKEEEHLLYASVLALGKYLNVPIPNFDYENNPMISILNQKIALDKDKLDYLDINFLSTLIGSSFIEEKFQIEILKLFNPEIQEIEIQPIMKSPQSQHEPVQLPLSLSQ